LIGAASAPASKPNLRNHERRSPMELLLVIIIVILLFGGGFSLYRR
jgi:hypothetical protein